MINNPVCWHCMTASIAPDASLLLCLRCFVQLQSIPSSGSTTTPQAEHHIPDTDCGICFQVVKDKKKSALLGCNQSGGTCPNEPYHLKCITEWFKMARAKTPNHWAFCPQCTRSANTLTCHGNTIALPRQAAILPVQPQAFEPKITMTGAVAGFWVGRKIQEFCSYQHDSQEYPSCFSSYMPLVPIATAVTGAAAGAAVSWYQHRWPAHPHHN